MNTKLVSKSNALINASYRLTLTEIQIVLYGISLINPLKKKFPFEYVIDIKRFSSIFCREHGEIYNDIKEAIKKRFWERDFSYTNEEGEVVTCRWLTRVIHKDNTGFIQIKFSEDVQPYLHQLQKNFTTYYLDQVTNFKSLYSIRFYEFAIMHLKKDAKVSFKIKLEDLRSRLELNDKYNRFCDLKTRVLEPATKEINKHSNLNITYKVKRQGRTPYEIKFTINKKISGVEKKLPQPKKILKLETSTLETAKKLALAAKTGWDIYAIEQQFYDFVKKKGAPENFNAAFIGFVQKKILKAP